MTASQLDVLAEITGLPGFRAKMTFRGDDFRTVINLVAAGLGIALLPSLVLSDLPRGGLGAGSVTCRSFGGSTSNVPTASR